MIATSSPTGVGSLSSPARSVPGPLAGSWLAAQGRLPLAFMGLGLAWMGAATAMLVMAPDVLALSHAAPAVVALAHAWVLGVFVSIATGAVRQIAPGAFGALLWCER